MFPVLIIFYALFMLSEFIYLAIELVRLKRKDLFIRPRDTKLAQDIEMIRNIIESDAGKVSAPDITGLFFSHYPFWIPVVRIAFLAIILWLTPAGYLFFTVAVAILTEFFAYAMRRKLARIFSIRVFCEFVPTIAHSLENRIFRAIEKAGASISSDIRKLLKKFIRKDGAELIERLESVLGENIAELNATIIALSATLDSDSERMSDNIAKFTDKLDATVGKMDDTVVKLDKNFDKVGKNLKETASAIELAVESFTATIGKLDHSVGNFDIAVANLDHAIDNLGMKLKKFDEIFAVGEEVFSKPLSELGEAVGAYMSMTSELSENASDILNRSKLIYSALDEFRSTLATTAEQFAKAGSPTTQLAVVIADFDTTIKAFIEGKLIPKIDEFTAKLDEAIEVSMKKKSFLGL